ncbi:MAG: hypothetical protein JZU53_07080 [Paludibacter sp.]|nr:hypothetical protein [Paludibacter sp.]
MRNIKRKTANTPAITKDELLDQIVPKRGVRSANEKLSKQKLVPDERTRSVSAKNFGYPSSTLSMLVLPILSDEEIRQKFEKRIGHVPQSNFRKTNHV